MTNKLSGPAGRMIARTRDLFAPRDFLFHNGRTLRRIRLTSSMQASAAVVGTAITGFAALGLVSAAGAAATATGVVAPARSEQRLAKMEQQLGQMETRVATIRHTAQLHAQRLDQRQALLAAALTGKPAQGSLALATATLDPVADSVSARALAPLLRAEQRQATLAGAARRVLDERYAQTASSVRKLGLAPTRVAGGMGGPLIPANSAEARADLNADAQFRSLFNSWKKLDTLEQGVISIPSVQPVSNLKFTSNFGIRTDPFRGTSAMHAGVDIPGPIGTPVYATADGIVGRAERAGGYGNLVELEHGKGIATRYGHLSKILVSPGAHVKRGQLIALMGSTGRSTGSHLHYEVRIDGHAVNPAPFLTTADYLLAAQDRAVGVIPVSSDGPAPQD